MEPRHLKTIVAIFSPFMNTINRWGYFFTPIVFYTKTFLFLHQFFFQFLLDSVGYQLTLRRFFLREPQALFWVDLAHHFLSANFSMKEWFYPKNNIGINYPEFISCYLSSSGISKNIKFM